MKNSYFLNFKQEACDVMSENIFFKMSGIKGNGKKSERMRKDAMNQRDIIQERVMAKATYVFYDEIRISGNQLEIGGQTLLCSAFEQLQNKKIDGAYVYALTAGDFSLPNEPVMNQLYADIWGSAYAEATRMLLIDELQKKARLSEGFGPGFYGMDVIEATKLAYLLDLDELGIEVRDNGILLPLKSCAGLYFSVSEDYETLNDACRSCLGNQKSCKLCNIHGGIKNV